MTTQTHTAATVTLPEGVAETHSATAVYAALLNGFEGTAKELTAEIGEGHIVSGVTAALNNLKAAGIAQSVKVKPSSNFSPYLWNLAPVATPAVEVEDDETAEDRDAAFAAALADVLGDGAEFPTMTITPQGFANDLLDEMLTLDAPAAPVTPRAPRTTRRGEVRLLAAYRNDPAPRERTTAGNGKQMGPILAFLMENAGTEYTIREIEKALGLPDYPSAATERLAADPSTGVQRIDFVAEGQKKSRKKFVYVAPTAPAAAE